jgi:predicted metal-dependent RNase
MTSIDKDFRFMATNDLMNELQNDSIKLDDDSERKVCFKDKDFSSKIKKIY